MKSVTGPQRGSLRVLFASEGWKGGVFGPYGLIDIRYYCLSVWTIIPSECMDRHSSYTPFYSKKLLAYYR